MKILKHKNLNYFETDNMMDVLPLADAIYMTRTQSEYECEDYTRDASTGDLYLHEDDGPGGCTIILKKLDDF